MSATAAADGDRMSIGEVLAGLRPEFPDITVSKIRFLESQGLVDPLRSPSGYRRFSAVDVDRLRYVLTVQRDHYLPLKVIKDQVDALVAGGTPQLSAVPRPDDAAVPPAQPPRPARRLTRAEMLTSSGLTEAALARLDASGLLNRRRGGLYDTDDLAVAAVVARLEEFGLEPRHLRAFRGAADREVGLIHHALGAPDGRRSPDDRARTTAAAAELVELLVDLHAGLLRAAVRRELGG